MGIQAADVHKAPSEDAASRASLTKTALRTDPSADELPSHANPTILGPVQAQRKWVQRSPEKLHLHPALVRLDLGQAAQDTAQAVRSTTAALLQTIVITTDGTLIAGLSAWRKAVDSGLSVVDCIEYPLTSQEALEAILIHNQPRRTWNNFTRVRLALELETYFQAKALSNQIAGGRHKGSAILPKAMHIDVREEIAALGAVSGRTVSNVKTILGTAAPAVIAALHSGMLKINRALQWCRLTGKEQLDRLTEHHIARDRYKAIRHAIAVAPAAVGSLSAVLESLRQHEARVPGSVSIRIGTGSRTEILLGQDFLSQPETVGGFIQ